MLRDVLGEHKLPAEFNRKVWNLEYDVRGFGELLAMRACLMQSGVDVEWEDLLGYAGDAFSCDGMEYFSVRGHDVLTQAARSYGFESRWGLGDEGAREDLRASLAKHQPCITPGLHGGCLWWVVVLEENAGQNEFLVAGAGDDPQWVTTPAGKDAPPTWVGQCPWVEGARTYPDGTPENWQPCPRFLLGDSTSPPLPSDRLREALRLAVAVHRREELAYHWGGGELETPAIGRGYLRKWPGLLREWSKLRGWSQTDEQEPLDDRDPDPPPCYRDSWFAAVAHGMRRRAAAAFLRARISEAADQARPGLESAAKHYDQSAVASGRILDAICSAECVRELDWYRRLQVGANYLGERDADGTAAAAAFAERHPDRWTARQAVLRSMNECLQDTDRVEEACRAAELVLQEDDAAIAAIEDALAAG